MIKPSDLVQAMSAAGAPIDAILIALRAIEDEHAAIAEQRAKAAERKRRQRERDSHVTVTGQSQDIPSLSLPPNEKISNPPTHTHPDNNTRARKGWACPDGIDAQHWADFLANRKLKRLAVTETAYRGVLREIAKFADDEWPPGRIVQHAAERGWGGIFDPRNSNGIGNHGNNRNFGGASNASSRGTDGLGPTARAAIAAFGHPDDDYPGLRTVGRS